MNHQPENWVAAPAADGLTEDERAVVKTNGKRIAVFSAHGELYAIDNNCPHEGYPLAKGELSDCVLTCKWHNFKFDIRTGACLMGDEPVRTFPIRIRKGHVEIDIADPPAGEVRARLLKSLERGLLDRKLGQIARDVVRLLSIGTTPAELMVFAANFDACYAEWGTTHVVALALDVLDEAETRAESDPFASAVVLMQVFELAADSHTRRTPRSKIAPADVRGKDPDELGVELVALIEAERGDDAEALLRGAIDAKVSLESIEGWLFEAVCEHFLDFGHRMIYQVKLFDLIRRCEITDSADLLCCHLAGIVNGTREDTLPAWAYLEDRWKTIEPRASDLAVAAAASNNDAPRPSLIASLIDGDRLDAASKLIEALDGGLSLRGAVNALATAACERLLRFDITHDASPENQHNWLDVTHTLTYANALRSAITRTGGRTILRAIYHGVRFVNAAGALDMPREDQDLPVALEAEPADALAHRGWHAILEDNATRPIVVTHLIKTLVACLDEHNELKSDKPLLAFARLLDSPIRERRVGRATHEAIRLIRDGKVPRTLL